MSASRVNLLGLPQAKLRDFFAELGEPPYRARQALRWIHHAGVRDFRAMTTFSKALRGKLAEAAEVRPPEAVSRRDSKDGSRKWAIRCGGDAAEDAGRSAGGNVSAAADAGGQADATAGERADAGWQADADKGGIVETVFIPEGKRGTLCISSQVGCSLDCSFCATGKQGFQRDLSAAEIIGQLWLAEESFRSDAAAEHGAKHAPGNSVENGAGNGRETQPANAQQRPRRITNVVMMGMGEPLLNFDNVVDAMDLMQDDNGYGLSRRRVTLSTAGVVPALDKLAEVSAVTLAVSLHAPNNVLRNELVPLNRKYPIEQLLASCRNYLARQRDRKRVVTIEYTLIAGVNDQPGQAAELAELLRDFPCKINLIPFNPFPGSDYGRPSGKAIARFWQVLADAGFIVTVRATRGDDIAAACGQLAGRVADRTRRAARHAARREMRVEALQWA